MSINRTAAAEFIKITDKMKQKEPEKERTIPGNLTDKESYMG